MHATFYLTIWVAENPAYTPHISKLALVLANLLCTHAIFSNPANDAYCVPGKSLDVALKQIQ